MSTHHTEPLWSNIQSAEWLIIGADLLNTKATNKFVTSGTFRARLVIEGNFKCILERDFRISSNQGKVIIEDIPKTPWPRFILELVDDPKTEQFRVIRVAIEASNDSVDAAILSTKFLYLIAISGKFSIQAIDETKLLSLELNPLPNSVKQEISSATKFYRKLKYIEDCFKEKFTLPKDISITDIKLVEIIFRGITEGEFTARDSQFVFEKTAVRKADLNNPPFNSEGEIRGRLTSSIILFNKNLDLGSIDIYLGKALLGDAIVIDKVNENPNQPIDIRFEVLDNQVTYRFERYAKQSKKQRLRRLKQFKQKLALEEPKDLVDLIDESLQNDVSADEARQIAAGWRQYNDLPDRFCPQEPILDEAKHCWRVPIYLVYANGEGGQVGEVTIDLKTGKIIQQTAIEEMFQTGRNIKDADDSDALSRAVAKMINRTPEEIAEAQARAIANCKPEHPLQPGQTIFDAVGGKWPGDESDQQIKEALGRLS